MELRALQSKEVASFSASLERIHAETDLAAFPERMFGVIESILDGVFITVDEFELSTGASRNSSNRPIPEGWIDRLRELAPAEHPAYSQLEQGVTDPMRLEDLISQRQLRKTALHHEIFAPMEIRHQIVLPLLLPGHVAAFTLNRDTAFTDSELCVARLLGPHLALAHVHAQNSTALAKLRELDPQAEEFGLTTREREVLFWVGEGKRDAEIGSILGISRRTVGKHVENILAKLGAETRGAAVAMYLRR